MARRRPDIAMLQPPVQRVCKETGRGKRYEVSSVRTVRDSNDAILHTLLLCTAVRFPESTLPQQIWESLTVSAEVLHASVNSASHGKSASRELCTLSHSATKSQAGPAAAAHILP